MQYLAACRWPDGFVCPRCGNQRAYALLKLKRWQCTGCRHQVSLTAGTILHNTKTPLTVWFWAAYLMTTAKRGISALLLQRQLALERYETARMMLHKFRRAMINLGREPLRGEVEVDETWVGGTQAGLRGSRQLKGRKAALVLVAVEKRGRASGRARMAVIPDFRSATLIAFLKQNVEAGSTVYTDGLKSFTGLPEAGFQHVPRSQPLRIELRQGAKSAVPLADRAIDIPACPCSTPTIRVKSASREVKFCKTVLITGGFSVTMLATAELFNELMLPRLATNCLRDLATNVFPKSLGHGRIYSNLPRCVYYWHLG